jgi:hypothetical protein
MRKRGRNVPSHWDKKMVRVPLALVLPFALFFLARRVGCSFNYFP